MTTDIAHTPGSHIEPLASEGTLDWCLLHGSGRHFPPTEYTHQCHLSQLPVEGAWSYLCLVSWRQLYQWKSVPGSRTSNEGCVGIIDCLSMLQCWIGTGEEQRKIKGTFCQSSSKKKKKISSELDYRNFVCGVGVLLGRNGEVEYLCGIGVWGCTWSVYWL